MVYFMYRSGPHDSLCGPLAVPGADVLTASGLRFVRKGQIDDPDGMSDMTMQNLVRPEPNAGVHNSGRLLSRPTTVESAGATGFYQLGIARGRDGFLIVPERYRHDTPAPMAVMLHGAGGSAIQAAALLRAMVNETGIIVLAPDSRLQTWDMLLGGWGPDVAFIDQALELTFSRYSIDPTRLAIGGFSDGASYALSLGLANGDLFSHILAFSPGFATPPSQQGQPLVYVSHGTNDQVLPINACSRRLVPNLSDAGYDVTYHEFDGPHTVPPDIAREALHWFLDGTLLTNNSH